MSFIKSLFKYSKPKNPTSEQSFNIEDFWRWFVENEQTFFQVVKDGKNIETKFLEKIIPKLKALGESYWLLTGMKDDTTAELIITADGIIKYMAAVEELVAAAPQLDNWVFTAHKPATDINRLQLQMNGYTFNADNIHFYPIEHKEYPDEIDIVIVHDDFTEENKVDIGNGTYIFLDNYIGELRNVTTIDNLHISSKEKAEKELIPIEKLKDYLIWREKEFVEKYEGLRHQTDEDSYSLMEATLDNGLPLFATINTTLLQWDYKASHPWIASVKIKYNGNEHGIPDKVTYELLNNIEDEILAELKDSEGYLYIGRETANSMREIYFAFFDFRKPSQVLHSISEKYQDQLDIDFEIYKDKYWRSFQHYVA